MDKPKVYKVSWNTITDYAYYKKDNYKLFTSEEKYKDFYKKLIDAANLIGINISPRVETMEIE